MHTLLWSHAQGDRISSFCLTETSPAGASPMCPLHAVSEWLTSLDLTTIVQSCLMDQLKARATDPRPGWVGQGDHVKVCAFGVEDRVLVGGEVHAS